MGISVHSLRPLSAILTTIQQSSSSEIRERLLRYRWFVYGVQVTSMLVVNFQFVLPATIGNQLATEWNLDATALGLLGAVLFYIYAMMQVPSGFVLDVWGPRKSSTVGLLIMAVGQLVFSLANGLEVALIGRALIGFGAGPTFIAILKNQVKWFRVREFATLVGVVTIVAFSGSILGTAPLAYMVTQLGWRVPVLIVAGFTLALAVVNWMFVRDDPRDLGYPSISQIDPDAPSATMADSANPQRRELLREAITTWRRTRPVWIVSLIVMLGYGSFQSFQLLWAGSYLIHVHQQSTVTAATTLLSLLIGAGVGSIVAGYLSDNVFHARRPFIIAGALGTSFVWVVIVAMTSEVGALRINVVFALLSFIAGFMLMGVTMVKEAVRPEIFGTVFGAFNTFAFLGNALFQLLMGALLNISDVTVIDGSRIYGLSGYRLTFSAALAGSLIALVLAFVLPETLRKKQTDE